MSRNRPRGHAQKPPRDVPSRGISAKLGVAAGRSETKRAIVVLLLMDEIRIFTKNARPLQWRASTVTNKERESTIFGNDSTGFFRSPVFLIFLEIGKKRVFRLGCAP